MYIHELQLPEGFLMNEKRSERQGLMFWFEILFKNVINVNKEFLNHVHTTNITYCLTQTFTSWIQCSAIAQRITEFFFSFSFFFAASCVTWRRHEPAYHFSSKEPTLVLGSWSGTTSCCMRCVLHSASFIFEYVHCFSPTEEHNNPTARPSCSHQKQHFLLDL